MTNPAETLPAVQSDSASLMTLLVKVASDPAADVAKIERLAALVEHQQQRQAEQEFNLAMVEAQAEMPRVQKNKENDHTKSSYANLDAVIKDVTPIYTKHGFSLSFGTAESPKAGLRVVCHVAHRGGFARDYMADIPVDSQGAKNPVQGFGSSVSYARRYLTLMIFNISTTDDDDGNASGGAGCITPDQVAWIEQVLTEHSFPLPTFLKWAGVDRVEDIAADKWQRVQSALRTKIEQKGASK